jgi:hypothetical protein
LLGGQPHHLGTGAPPHLPCAAVHGVQQGDRCRAQRADLDRAMMTSCPQDTSPVTYVIVVRVHFLTRRQ